MLEPLYLHVVEPAETNIPPYRVGQDPTGAQERGGMFLGGGKRERIWILNAR
jgi:hypothetical protein